MHSKCSSRPFKTALRSLTAVGDRGVASVLPPGTRRCRVLKNRSHLGARPMLSTVPGTWYIRRLPRQRDGVTKPQYVPRNGGHSSLYHARHSGAGHRCWQACGGVSSAHPWRLQQYQAAWCTFSEPSFLQHGFIVLNLKSDGVSCHRNTRAMARHSIMGRISGSLACYV